MLGPRVAAGPRVPTQCSRRLQASGDLIPDVSSDADHTFVDAIKRFAPLFVRSPSHSDGGRTSRDKWFVR